MQLIRHFPNEACRPGPQTEAEIRRLSRGIRELSCRALLFLLRLARDYSPNPFELIRDHFAQAMAAADPPLTLDDFAHLETTPPAAAGKSPEKE